MAALNQEETESLSLACRAMSDAAVRLKRATEDPERGFNVEMDPAEVGFMIDSLKKAERLVNTVKQVKGYYPK